MNRAPNIIHVARQAILWSHSANTNFHRICLSQANQTYALHLLFIKNMQNMGVEISDSLIPAKRSPRDKNRICRLGCPQVLELYIAGLLDLHWGHSVCPRGCLAISKDWLSAQLNSGVAQILNENDDHKQNPNKRVQLHQYDIPSFIVHSNNLNSRGSEWDLSEVQCYKSVCLGQVYIECAMCCCTLLGQVQNRRSIERPKVTQEDNSDTRGFLQAPGIGLFNPEESTRSQKRRDKLSDRGEEGEQRIISQVAMG